MGPIPGQMWCSDSGVNSPPMSHIAERAQWACNHCLQSLPKPPMHLHHHQGCPTQLCALCHRRKSHLSGWWGGSASDRTPINQHQRAASLHVSQPRSIPRTCQLSRPSETHTLSVDPLTFSGLRTHSRTFFYGSLFPSARAGSPGGVK